MRSICLVLVTSVALSLCIQSLLSWETLAEDTTGTPKSQNIQLPNIFDWNHYKEAFQKGYTNRRDELIRNKMFIANALKTFFHNVGFRMGKFSYFLSINQFTDNTPEEIKKMYSGLKLGSFKRNTGKHYQSSDFDAESTEQQQAFVDIDLDQLKQELSQIIDEKQPGYEIIAQELGVRINKETNRRKMRSSAPKQSTQAVTIPTKGFYANSKISDFRSMVDDIAPEESNKFTKLVPPTNPQYEPIEMIDNSIIGIASDDEIVVPKREISSAQYVHEQLSKLTDGDRWSEKEVASPVRIKRSLEQQKQDSNDEPGLENKLFVDWRESGCLTIVRDQRRCGSCYAFATMSLMEFLHCHQTGKLVPFSEQYMVDCGKKHVEDMNGCDGAAVESMAQFIYDWGVELRSNYPYRGFETVCPYENNDHAGYMKPSFEAFGDIYQRILWPEILKESGPMIAVIVVPTDFSFYGGKVHQGKNCGKEDDMHAMLLVGHGIEDGYEYWLYKNSHGYYWGEQGYFKLAKQADNDCFGPHINTRFRFQVEDSLKKS